MSSPESIIQTEDAAMADLFNLSVMSPRTVFPGEDFEKYTSRYLDLLVTSVAGVARLHPNAVTCSLHTMGGDELDAYNHKSELSAHQAWYGSLDQPHSYKQLSFNAQMDSYVLQVKANKGQKDSAPFKSIDIAQSNGGQIMECAQLIKPFILGKDRAGVRRIEEGGYFARARSKTDYIPFNAYTLDVLRPSNVSRESILQRLTFPEDKRAYKQHGNEGWFASVLWRMGRELCIAAKIAPPNAN